MIKAPEEVQGVYVLIRITLLLLSVKLREKRTFYSLLQPVTCFKNLFLFCHGLQMIYRDYSVILSDMESTDLKTLKTWDFIPVNQLNADDLNLDHYVSFLQL